MKVQKLFEEEKFKGKKEKAGKYYVETWWDRRSKNWVTQILDSNDYEVIDPKTEVPISSIYTGNKDSARSAHEDYIKLAKTLK
jgi:cobalamin-dependent methionine synthase I